MGSIKRMLPVLAVTAFMAVPAVAQGALLSNAATSPGKATGAAVELGGLLVVGKSATSKDDAKVTAVNVAGIELLGHQNGKHRGALAPLGPVLDGVNNATCEGGVDDPDQPCLLIAHMNTREVEGEEGTDEEGSSQREANVVILGSNSRASGLKVAGSDAVSQHDTNGSDDDTCSDAASGWVLTGQDSYVPGLNQTLLQNESISFNQNCNEGETPAP
jgi:hypothetical protein